MASYNELNALIDAYINRNGVQAITGQILNGVLKAMVEQLGRGYTIMGAATPATDPGTPDGPECYFASTPGTYTDFDGLQVVPGELALLCYTPTDGWTKATIYEGFQEVGATIDGNVGTPSVGVSYADGVLSFDFHNMKGNPGQDGQDGAAAGFGTIDADITGGVGTPGVSVESSGPATAKNLQFHFTNLKGETGVTSVVATVDNTTGTPACTVSLVGQQLTLAFTGLKGAQGNTGSSVDYPFTIVNNLTTNDATQALSAAMGVQLESEVSQLEAKVTDLEDTVDGVVGGDTVISYDRSEAIGYSIDSSGKWVHNNSGIIIPITAGKIYKVSGDGTNGTIVGILTSADNIAANVAVSFSSQFPSRISILKDETFQFTAPNDANYLFMLLHSSAGDLYPVLKEHIEQLDGLVTLFPRMDSAESKNEDQDEILLGGTPKNNSGVYPPIDLTQYNTSNFSILNTGKWSASGKCKFIPVSSFAGVRVEGGTTGQIIAFLKTANPVSGEIADFATGYSNRVVVNSGKSVDFSIPVDCVYLYALVETTGGDARTPKISEIFKFADDGVLGSIKELQGLSLGEQETILDAQMTKKNIYITSDGDVASGYSSASIPCSGYEKVVLDNPNGYTLYFTFLTEDIVLGEDVSYAEGYLGISSVSARGTGTFEIPQDAQYLYISINITTYPDVVLKTQGYDERISEIEGETSALTGITVPLDYQEEGDGTAGIGPALSARTGGGKVVIPKGIYGITEQIIIPGRNLNIEGAVWNYPQDPNGVHPSNTGTKLALLTNEIESVFKTQSDMSGMRMSQLGFQGLTTVWDYEDADGNGADYYFDPNDIKNVGLYIGSGRFDQVSLHRLSFCGLAVGILAKYTIDANVWSEINTDGCDYGILVDYSTCHHPKLLNNIVSDCVASGILYKTSAGQNSYGAVIDGNVLVRNASYLTPAQISAGYPQASLVLIGHRFASVINNTIVLSGVYKRQAGGENYTAYEGGIGLYFTGDHSVIRGNKIVWSTSKAATISGNYNTISGNVIEDEHDGVSVSGNYNSITGNVFDSVLSVTGDNNRIEGNTHSGAITLSGNNNEIHGGPSDIITVSGNNNVLVGFSSANVTDNGTGTVIK